MCYLFIIYVFFYSVVRNTKINLHTLISLGKNNSKHVQTV